MMACLRCQFDLQGVDASSRCPECGYRVDLSENGIGPDHHAKQLALSVVLPFALFYTCLSGFTFVSAGVGEPFYRYADWPHMIRYVIVPSAGIALALSGAIVLGLLVVSKRLPSWFLLIVVWLSLASLPLWMGMHRYLIDIIEMGSWDSVPP